MSTDAEGYASGLRQQLGLNGKADERLLVQVEGSAVLVKRVTKAKPSGPTDSKPAKPELPPLIRIDLASPP